MKVIFINGSPKNKDSASSALIDQLIGIMEKDMDQSIILELHKPQITEEQKEEIYNSDAIVFAFPLYVDGIPSHLLSNMKQLQNYFNERENRTIRVYALVNCGFFEGIQNALAIDMVKNWTNKADLIWGQGIGIGAGGMIGSLTKVPLGKGPKKNIGTAFYELADNIIKLKSADNKFVEPNFPRFAYILAAHMGWRNQVKQNGLKANEISRQL